MAKAEAGKGIPRLIQIRFDDARPGLRPLLDLGRMGLCKHGRAFESPLGVTLLRARGRDKNCATVFGSRCVRHLSVAPAP